MVNSKENCSNEQELFQCITKRGGPSNVHCQEGTVTKRPYNSTKDLKNVRTYNTFRFESDGIRCWKQGFIGGMTGGVLVKMKSAVKKSSPRKEGFGQRALNLFSSQESPKLDQSNSLPAVYNYRIHKANEDKRTIHAYKEPGKQEFVQGEDVEDIDDLKELNGCGKDGKQSINHVPMKTVYYCSNPRCDMVYLSYKNWQKHENSDNCAIKLRTHSQLDGVTYQFVSRFSASRLEAKNLKSRNARRHFMTPLCNNLDFIPYLESLPRLDSKMKVDFHQGWVFLEPDSDTSEEENVKKITQEQRDFIKELFNYGQDKNNEKILPEEARKIMINAKNGDGTRKFKRSLWLKVSQIRSLYGRFAAELKNKNVDPSPEAIEEEALEMDREARRDVVESIATSLEEGEELSDQQCPLIVSTYPWHMCKL